MSVRLNGSTSGFTELDGPAVGSNNTLRLPAGNGSDGQVFGTDGAGNGAWVTRSRMQLDTAKASTSGNVIDFTGIPSWAKKISVLLNGVSTAGTSPVQVQLGTSAGLTTSGYVSSAAYSSGTIASNTGFVTYGATAANTRYGCMLIASMGDGTWVASGNNISDTASNGNYPFGGAVTITGTVDRLRITTVAGNQAFDAGTINVLYEG